MVNPYMRFPHTDSSRPASGEAPNAALLIDFDNVTMGMRSDLAKELKNLLDSDIIKGKVTVQRAYADWRRYPQYIVPLSEASIDLIFAPAYGSSKKNATDIRMAIDGIELVFIRPEIGTFILLTGDSDFSSLVLKLKEYGKYVIGIGIQESSSDILVQNCDEYYSYTALTGLSKERGVGAPDPWQCVEEALGRMTERGDIMRSDRLKQVMMEISPSFSERNFGFKKFSKFLVEAANKGLLGIQRGENGQYLISPPEKAAGTQPSRGADPARNGEETPRKGRRVPASRRTGAAGGSRKGSRKEGEGRSRPPTRDAGHPRDTADTAPALDLLRRALKELGGEGKVDVRDADLKRRLLALDRGFDEGAFGFSKFSKFLLYAEKEGAVALERQDSGNYRVRPASSAGGTSRTGSDRSERNRRSTKSKGKGAGSRPAKTSPSTGKRGESEVPAEVDSKALGLPTTRDAIKSYLANRYRGVGVRTAEALVKAFGTRLFTIFRDDPEKIDTLLPPARAQQVRVAWKEDYERRTRALRVVPEEAVANPSDSANDSAGRPTTRRRAGNGAHTSPAGAAPSEEIGGPDPPDKGPSPKESTDPDSGPDEAPGSEPRGSSGWVGLLRGAARLTRGRGGSRD